MGLKPGTEYRITLYTLYDGGEVATPVTTFQTGECCYGSPELSPTIPSLWHGGLSHSVAQSEDCLGHETPQLSGHSPG